MLKSPESNFSIQIKLYGDLIGKKPFQRYLFTKTTRKINTTTTTTTKTEGKMKRSYFNFVPVMNLLTINSLLAAIVTLTILQTGKSGIWFVNSSTIPTPYPDVNARPTITSKLENFKSDLHRSTTPNITSSTESYINIFNGNDTYGKLAPSHFVIHLFQSDESTLSRSMIFDKNYVFSNRTSFE